MAPVVKVDGGTVAVPRSSLDDIIDLYKRDVDRTLLRENLKLSPDQRVRKMIATLEFVEELRRAPKRSMADLKTLQEERDKSS